MLPSAQRKVYEPKRMTAWATAKRPLPTRQDPGAGLADIIRQNTLLKNLKPQKTLQVLRPWIPYVKR